MPSENLANQDIVKPLTSSLNTSKIIIGALILSLILGALTGYILATKSPSSKGSLLTVNGTPPKNPQQDTKTFRDFAEGVIKPKPSPSDPTEYTEGTHLLVRDKATSVALTSSVVDLSKYEGKKVKVYGETQKAFQEGWLMDVGRVEEIK